MNLNGVECYYVRNAQGDIIGLFDKSGAQVVSYTYDSFGKLISTTGTLASTIGVKNQYRYRGYRYDSETGLYYLNSRYYNPEWGKFINADRLSGELGELLSNNLFIYCGNNPVSRLDPNGHLWGLIAGAIGTVAAVIGIPIEATVIAIVATVLTVAYVGYMIGTAIGNAYYNNRITHSVSNSLPYNSPSVKFNEKSKPSSKSKTFPKNPKELDNVLGKQGKKVKDGPTTTGRDKTKWELPNDVTVTHEQHPYDTNAPEFHKGPHYHVDGPGFNHNRFMPGDQLPNIFP